MRRRNFLLLAAGNLAGLTRPVLAQPSAMPIVGFLNGGSPGPFAHLAAAFRDGLRETGFIEGRNVAVEYRWAEGDSTRLPTMASALVARPVAVIVATGGEQVTFAARSASATIPVVFVFGRDPVAAGLIASLARPGGNLTGFMQFAYDLAAKRFTLLREAVPHATIFALLLNPADSGADLQRREAEEAATRLGVRLIVQHAGMPAEIEPAFAALARQGAQAVLVAAAPFFNTHRAAIVALAARHRMPAMYEWRDFPAIGGLLSYGSVLADAYRQVGIYAGRIVQGARAADLPVIQPTRFQLVVNLAAARALGIEVPASILAQADEVIE